MKCGGIGMGEHSGVGRWHGATVGLVAGLAAGPTVAQMQEPAETAMFPAVTIMGKYTVRVNAVTFHGSDFNAFKDGGAEGRRCGALVQLYDVDGNVVASERVQVGPRESAGVEVSGAEIGLAPDERLTVHGAIGIARKRCARTMTGSLEISDTATGEVIVVVPATKPLDQ